MEFFEHKAKFDAYISDIVEYRINSPKQIRDMCLQHIEDMDRIGNDDGFAFWFDFASVEDVLGIISHCKLTSGPSKGQLFEVSSWQRLVVFMVYGWRYKISNKRRYDHVCIITPRKWGVTEFMAAIGLYGLAYDEYEEERHICWCDDTRNRALTSFSAFERMVKLFDADRTPPNQIAWNQLAHKSGAKIRHRGSNSYGSWHTTRGENIGISPYYLILDHGAMKRCADDLDFIIHNMDMFNSSILWEIGSNELNGESYKKLVFDFQE